LHYFLVDLQQLYGFWFEFCGLCYFIQRLLERVEGSIQSAATRYNIMAFVYSKRVFRGFLLFLQYQFQAMIYNCFHGCTVTLSVRHQPGGFNYFCELSSHCPAKRTRCIGVLMVLDLQMYLETIYALFSWMVL